LYVLALEGEPTWLRSFRREAVDLSLHCAHADTGRMRAALARWVVLGMVALAIVVQIGVWGATKINVDGGSLLESWRPYFGWPYGLLFAALQLAVCRWFAVARGPVWLARTWGITGGALVLIWELAGQPERLTVDYGVACTAGVGAMMLAAGLFNGDLVPRR
jgi:hypothetical protein